MSRLAMFAAGVASVTFMVAMMAVATQIRTQVVYDCRMLHGGWHPDVPLEVQKLCRETL